MNKTLKKYLRELKKVGGREKAIIVSILLASFAIGIVGSYAYKNLSKPTTYNTSTSLSASPQLTTSPAPLPKTALLSLMSDANQLSVGNKFDITLKLNSGNLGVEAADFVVNFDSNYLIVASVSTGTFFKNYPINTTGDNFVKLSGVADFTEKSVIVPKGEGNVATITFETLQATESTKIAFDKVKTIIAASGQNILDNGKLEDLKISIVK